MITDISFEITQSSPILGVNKSLQIEKSDCFSFAVFQDWKANKGNIKGRLVMLAYRIAHLATINKVVHVLMIPYLVFYKVFVLWFLGVEIQHRAKIGRGLKMSHGIGLVVHKSTTIGKNCSIRQCTTIGNKTDADGNKTAGTIIGDNVDIGANVCIIGKLMIGSNSTIGAGSVVVKNIPEKVVVAGNPARIIKSL